MGKELGQYCWIMFAAVEVSSTCWNVLKILLDNIIADTLMMPVSHALLVNDIVD